MQIRKCDVVINYSEVRDAFMKWFPLFAADLKGSLLDGLRDPQIDFENGRVAVAAVKPMPFRSECMIKVWLKPFVVAGGKTLGVRVEKLSAGFLGLGWVAGLIVKMAARRLNGVCGVSAESNALLLDVRSCDFGCGIVVDGRITACDVRGREIEIAVESDFDKLREEVDDKCPVMAKL